MINLERLEQLQSVSVSEWVSRRKKEGKKKPEAEAGTNPPPPNILNVTRNPPTDNDAPAASRAARHVVPYCPRTRAGQCSRQQNPCACGQKSPHEAECWGNQ
jgi:hypothetical protein